MKKIKNTQEIVDTWCGQQIQPSEYYILESFEYNKWANDSKVLSDVGSGKLRVNNGTSDIIDIATAVNFLKDSVDKFNEQGYKIVAPTFEDTQGLTTIWKGHLYVAQPSSLNIYDEVVTTQLKLRGGWYKVLCNSSNIGDYIEFAIVDKDNVLGLFAYFGLTVGVDVLELKKFVRTEYVNPLCKDRQDFQSGGASEVMAGLYFRTYYYNTGTSAVNFSVTEKYHET